MGGSGVAVEMFLSSICGFIGFLSGLNAVV